MALREFVVVFLVRALETQGVTVPPAVHQLQLDVRLAGPEYRVAVGFEFKF